MTTNTTGNHRRTHTPITRHRARSIRCAWTRRFPNADYRERLRDLLRDYPDTRHLCCEFTTYQGRDWTTSDDLRALLAEADFAYGGLIDQAEGR